MSLACLRSFIPSLALAATLGLSPAPLASAQQTVPQGARFAIPSFAPVVQKILPAVVNIASNRSAAAADEDAGDSAHGSGGVDELLRRFFEPFGGPGEPGPGTRVTAQGSGFIVDPDGFIVTSAHVVEGAQQITVALQDNSRYPATIVGRDESSDLAVIRIDARRPLPTVTWGDSDTAAVGDWILAVGNPFGLGGSVSAGILSARGRDIHAGPYDDFLQIDAPLNRGNSGGPAFNAAGEVIGVNTAIYTPTGGSVGIGFAVPSNLARPVIDQLRTHGKVVRGWLGAQVQEVTPAIARGFGLPRAQGALVTEVTPGGPADKAGLKRGDVVLDVNSSEVAEPRDLSLAVAAAPIGRKLALSLWRDGRRVALSAVIQETPEANADRRPQGQPEPGVSSLMGVRFTALTDNLRRELGLGAAVRGVLVLEVSEDSPFAVSGLDRGDVIEEIDRHAATSPEAAASLLREAAANPDRTMLMLINRQGIVRYLAFTPNATGAME